MSNVATRLRTILVGCGQIGRLHAARLAADSRFEVQGVCDPNLAAAMEIGKAISPSIPGFADLESALSAGPIDVAVVCTPTGLHFSQVRHLRERGIAVLCEKPLADTRERIAELVSVCESGPLLSIAYQRRYAGSFRTVRKLIQSGDLGPVRTISVYNCERWAQTIAGTWRDDPAQNPGGFLGDAGSHKIDCVFFVTGLTPRRVWAWSSRRGHCVDVVTQIQATLEGDVPLSMTFNGDAHHYSEEFHFHCADGDLILRDNTVELGRGNQLEKLADLEPDSQPIAAFADCLLAGAPNAAPPAIALPIWDFTFNALKSAECGRPIDIPG